MKYHHFAKFNPLPINPAILYEPFDVVIMYEDKKIKKLKSYILSLYNRVTILIRLRPPHSTSLPLQPVSPRPTSLPLILAIISLTCSTEEIII